jgi:hypothetical protein
MVRSATLKRAEASETLSRLRVGNSQLDDTGLQLTDHRVPQFGVAMVEPRTCRDSPHQSTGRGPKRAPAPRSSFVRCSSSPSLTFWHDNKIPANADAIYRTLVLYGEGQRGIRQERGAATVGIPSSRLFRPRPR